MLRFQLQHFGQSGELPHRGGEAIVVVRKLNKTNNIIVIICYHIDPTKSYLQSQGERSWVDGHEDNIVDHDRQTSVVADLLQPRHTGHDAHAEGERLHQCVQCQRWAQGGHAARNVLVHLDLVRRGQRELSQKTCLGKVQQQNEEWNSTAVRGNSLLGTD